MNDDKLAWGVDGLCGEVVGGTPKTVPGCISDSLVHFPDPLFPFEAIVPDAEPLPDPTSSRPHQAFDGLDLIGKSFVDPDLGVCTVISDATLLFLQSLSGNLASAHAFHPVGIPRCATASLTVTSRCPPSLKWLAGSGASSRCSRPSQFSHLSVNQNRFNRTYRVPKMRK